LEAAIPFTGRQGIETHEQATLNSKPGNNGIKSPETVRLDPKKAVITTTTVRNPSQGTATA
jgi:hypothetical protein